MRLMVKFAAAPGEVTVLAEVLRQRHPILVLWQIPKPIEVAIDAGVGGGEAGHNRRARWAAQGRGTISLFKKDAALCEGINIRSLGLWMTAQTSDPVIKVIYCDEQYVRLRRGLSLPSPEEYETQGGLKNETRHYCLATLLCGVFAQQLGELRA